MQTKEFLEHVWPDSGYYCIVSKDEKNKVIPTFFNTIDEAVADAERIVKENKDAYFACSTFQENTKREQANAKEEKALWIDIDCGYDKGKNKCKHNYNNHDTFHLKFSLSVVTFLWLPG